MDLQYSQHMRQYSRLGNISLVHCSLHSAHHKMDIQIIKSHKGKDRLCIDGYFYTKKSSCTTKIFWACSSARSRNCKGTVTTTLIGTQPRNFKEHNHVADPVKIEVEKTKMKMKEDAQTGMIRPKDIVAQNLSTASDVVRANLGRIDSLLRALRRHRQQQRLCLQQLLCYEKEQSNHTFSLSYGTK